MKSPMALSLEACNLERNGQRHTIRDQKAKSFLPFIIEPKTNGNNGRRFRANSFARPY
jgi:hypothetical protein